MREKKHVQGELLIAQQNLKITGASTTWLELVGENCTMDCTKDCTNEF